MSGRGQPGAQPQHMGRLLAALDTAVLSRVGDAEFESLVPLPDWFGTVFTPAGGEQRVRVDDEFSFLSNFLSDADWYRRQGRKDVVWSGPWTEETPVGQLVLEAGATTIDGDSILVVKLLGKTTSELQEILQSAREQSLRFEDLFRGEEEREKYRRYLESEVRKRTSELEETVGQLRRAIDELNESREEVARQREYFASLFNGTPEAVFLCDSDGRIIDFNPAFVQLFGVAIDDVKGRDIDEVIVPADRQGELRRVVIDDESDLPVALNDTVRKRVDGSLVPVSIIVAPVTVGGTGMGVIATYRDITEQKLAHQRLRDAFIDLVETMSRAMESMDPYTAGHQRRVAQMARRVGEVLGYDEAWKEGVYIGGLLHDVGKISIPPSILVKPGPLREEEWRVLQSHPVLGYEILHGTRLPWAVDLMARHHHEKLDGSGYPDGLKGDELTSEIRVLVVCDVLEAMSSHRPYRPARSIEVVKDELRGGRGSRYDEAVVDVVLGLIEAGEFPLSEPAF